MKMIITMNSPGTHSPLSTNHNRKTFPQLEEPQPTDLGMSPQKTLLGQWLGLEHVKDGPRDPAGIEGVQ